MNFCFQFSAFHNWICVLANLQLHTVGYQSPKGNENLCEIAGRGGGLYYGNLRIFYKKIVIIIRNIVTVAGYVVCYRMHVTRILN